MNIQLYYYAENLQVFVYLEYILSDNLLSVWSIYKHFFHCDKVSHIILSFLHTLNEQNESEIVLFFLYHSLQIDFKEIFHNFGSPEFIRWPFVMVHAINSVLLI